jgi:D-3-phosphoglycerate dehydrogenase
MGCVRKVAYKDRMIRNGRWNLHDDQPCHRIKDRVLGLIGYGAIARRFHEKTIGFGLSKVLVYDPYVDDEKIKESGAVPADLSSVLANSDYISVHVPLGDTTRGMIGKEQLQLMNEGAILINTSRGAVLNEADVTEALGTGRITGAGLDVFETEPLSEDSPLRKLDNVILSDHTGWYSEESKEELKTKAALNIVAVLKGGRPVYPVNEI